MASSLGRTRMGAVMIHLAVKTSKRHVVASDTVRYREMIGRILLGELNQHVASVLYQNWLSYHEGKTPPHYPVPACTDADTMVDASWQWYWMFQYRYDNSKCYRELIWYRNGVNCFWLD